VIVEGHGDELWGAFLEVLEASPAIRAAVATAAGDAAVAEEGDLNGNSASWRSFRRTADPVLREALGASIAVLDAASQKEPRADWRWDGEPIAISLGAAAERGKDRISKATLYRVAPDPNSPFKKVWGKWVTTPRDFDEWLDARPSRSGGNPMPMPQGEGEPS
jgi:hypothetical protein